MKHCLLLLLCSPALFYAQVTTGKIELGRNALLTWEITAFKEKEHIIGICKITGDEYICTIDGKPWYGSDYGMDKPKNQLTKLTMLIDAKTISLETTGMFNPSFSGALGIDHFKLKKEGDSYRLYAWFSDGAGGYSAQWRIIDGTAIRELISTSEEYLEWQKE